MLIDMHCTDKSTLSLCVLTCNIRRAALARGIEWTDGRKDDCENDGILKRRTSISGIKNSHSHFRKSRHSPPLRILYNIWSNQMKQMKIPEIIKKLPYKMRVSFKDIIDEKSWWGEKFKIRLRAWSPASISPLRSVNNKWGGRAKVVSIRRARSFFPPLYAPPLRSLAYCWFQSSPLHQRS